MKINTASVAKWLRQWFVVPPFVGSSPIVRPLKFSLFNSGQLTIVPLAGLTPLLEWWIVLGWGLNPHPKT